MVVESTSVLPSKSLLDDGEGEPEGWREFQGHGSLGYWRVWL